jgi:hypothetical protein
VYIYAYIYACVYREVCNLHPERFSIALLTTYNVFCVGTLEN